MKISKAKRLQHTEEYYFSRKLSEIKEMNAKGKQVINLGIGSPDLPPAPEVISALTQNARMQCGHSYQSYRGLDELREALADWYREHYSVHLDPASEVLPLMGSKEGIMHISLAFLNPGDKVLIPDPGYPTYKSVTELVGAETLTYNLCESNNWEPDLEQLNNEDLSDVKMMWVNYPHMPSGKAASRELFEKLLSFAKQHKILVVNDNPYSFILNKERISILSMEGAEDYALELNSLSKSFNMAGWRVGAVMGKKDYIDAVLQVKSNMDSGMFQAIQHGAIAALRLPESWYQKQDQIYAKRRILAMRILEKLDVEVADGQVGLFIWGKLPEGMAAEAFCDKLLQEKRVFMTPGSIFGQNGKSYIRISLCSSEEIFNEALGRINNTEQCKLVS